jgi:hypothetical protein
MCVNATTSPAPAAHTTFDPNGYPTGQMPVPARPRLPCLNSSPVAIRRITIDATVEHHHPR